MHLYTDEGDIDTTTNHPFYVIGRGWVAAGDLAVGDEVYNLDGTTSVVLGSEIEVLDEPVLVYNLEVEDFHSYFVGCVPVLVHNVCGKVAEYPEYIRQAKKYGKDHIKELSDGRIRFYGTLKPADKSGEMAGARLVREWNPNTGKERTWFETLDHSNNIRQVRPSVDVTGGTKVHYQFDVNGNYIGQWSDGG